MTVHWYRPSQCILSLVTVSSVLVIFGYLACGYVLYFAPEEPSKYISGGYYTYIPAIFLVAATALTIGTLILGCCGICRDSKVFLIIFAVCTIVVAGIQLGSTSSVLAFTMNQKVCEKLSNVMYKDLMDYSEPEVSENIFNSVQTNFNCCGVFNYSDWRMKNTTWSREEHNKKVVAPSSCCIDEHHNKTNCTETTTLKQQGCLDVLTDRIKMVVYAVFGFSIALTLLQVTTALVACYGALLIERYRNYDVL